MFSTSRLIIEVYDKNRMLVGWVGNPVSCTVTERWNALTTAQVTVQATDPIVRRLMEPGARVHIRYMTGIDSEIPFGVGGQLCAGMVRDPAGSILPDGTVTFQVQDDWRYLRNLLAWVKPNARLVPTALNDPTQVNYVSGETPVAGTVRGLSGRYLWPASPAVYPVELAVRDFLWEHLVTRWNTNEFPGSNRFSLYMGPVSDPRGPDVRPILPQVRFGRIEDYVVPLLEAGGLADSLSLKFVASASNAAEGIPSSTSIEFWEPTVWPQVFTPESGVIRGGDWSLTYPAATDVVAGGPGEDAARAFREVSDAALREKYSDMVEVFREATGAPVAWPESVTDEELKVPMYYHLRPGVSPDRLDEFERFLLSAMQKALSEGQEKAGLSVQLAESEAFRYIGGGGPATTAGFRTGDVMTVAASADTALAGITFQERITETTVSMSRETGTTVKPTLGERKDDPQKELAKAVRALARALRSRATNQ